MRYEYVDILKGQRKLTRDYNRVVSLDEAYREAYLQIKTSFHFKNTLYIKNSPDVYLIEIAHLPPNFTFSMYS